MEFHQWASGPAEDQDFYLETISPKHFTYRVIFLVKDSIRGLIMYSVNTQWKMIDMHYFIMDSQREGLAIAPTSRGNVVETKCN